MKFEKNISIIIVNYNVIELLLNCINSIYSNNTSTLEIEIILVDNNSTDGSVDVVALRFPEVHIITNKFNAGFPAANNQGIKIARGEFIFLLNPDTEILDDAIEKLMQFVEAQNTLCLVTPKLLNSDFTVQKSIQRFITVKEIIAELFFLHDYMDKRKGYFQNLKRNEIIKVEALSGAAIMMKKEVIDKIGTLDVDLFWTEDMEFCYRANLHGIDRIYFPKATIIHHQGQSGKKNMNVMLSNQVLSKIKFFKKNHSLLQYYTVLIFRLLHIISRLLIFGFLSFFNKIYRSKFSAYFYTLKRFIKNDY